MAREFEMECPCCGAKIVIEAASGKVLRFARRSSKGKPGSLDDVLAKMAEKPDRQEALFGEALRGEAKRGDELDDAFRRAQEKVSEKDDGEKPPSIYDFE